MAQLKNTTINGNLIVTGNVTTTSGADLNIIASGACNKYVQNTCGSRMRTVWEDGYVRIYVDHYCMQSFVPVWDKNLPSCNISYSSIVASGIGTNYIVLNDPTDGKQYRLLQCYNGSRGVTTHQVVSIDRYENQKYTNICIY